MKNLKYLIIFMGVICLLLMGSCNNNKDINIPFKVESDSPMSLLKNNPNADFLIIDEVVYTNASTIDWVKELNFEKGNLIGQIKRRNIKKDFSNWDATILKIGIEVFKSQQDEIVLVESDSKLIPYLEWREG